MYISRSKELQPEEHIFLTSDGLTTDWLPEADSLLWKKVRDYHISILHFSTEAIQLSPMSAVKIWNQMALAENSQLKYSWSAREVSLSRPKKSEAKAMFLKTSLEET